jgi:hypothetical protein
METASLTSFYLEVEPDIDIMVRSIHLIMTTKIQDEFPICMLDHSSHSGFPANVDVIMTSAIILKWLLFTRQVICGQQPTRTRVDLTKNQEGVRFARRPVLPKIAFSQEPTE